MRKLSSETSFKFFWLTFLAGSISALCATATFAQNVTTDIGTLDKVRAEKAFPAKPHYSLMHPSTKDYR